MSPYGAIAPALPLRSRSSSAPHVATFVYMNHRRPPAPPGPSWIEPLHREGDPYALSRALNEIRGER